MSESFSVLYGRRIRTTVDVNQLAQELIAISKSNLELNGWLRPYAFIVKPDGEVDIMSRETEPDSIAKKLSHLLVVEAAHAVNALAVVLISDAYYSQLDATELASYKNGDLAQCPSLQRRECVITQVYGPHGQYFIFSFYHHAPDKTIVWDEELDSRTTPGLSVPIANLLHPWWPVDQSKQ